MRSEARSRLAVRAALRPVWIWRGVAALWAVRTSWLAGAYVAGAADVARHHVETSGVILAALLLPALGGLRAARSADVAPARARARRLAPALILPAAALALYWPAVDVGLLSDDFVLLAWARTGAFVEESWGLVRPVPLVLWFVLDALVGAPAVPAALHVTNIVAHGVNAALVTLVARRIGFAAAPAWLAGTLFLAFPLAVEPVAWAAGVFDVLVTCFVLAAAAIAAGTVELPASRVAVVAVLVAAAVGTKETGVVAPVLIGLVVWYRHGFARAGGYRAAMGGAAVVAVYLAWRLAQGVAAGFPPLSGYTAKELVSRPFGALSVPFHADAVTALPIGAALAAAAIPLLVAVRALTPATTRLVVVAVLWALVAVAPMFTILFVGADLQGARYLYLSSVSWAILLAARPPEWPRGWRMAEWTLAGAALLIFVWAVRLHLVPWQQAGDAREALIGAIRERAAGCAAVAVEARPDHVRGAYVFRNGLEEALRARGVVVRLVDPGSDEAGPACTVPPGG